MGNSYDGNSEKNFCNQLWVVLDVLTGDFQTLKDISTSKAETLSNLLTDLIERWSDDIVELVGNIGNDRVHLGGNFLIDLNSEVLNGHNFVDDILFNLQEDVSGDFQTQSSILTAWPMSATNIFISYSPLRMTVLACMKKVLREIGHSFA